MPDVDLVDDDNDQNHNSRDEEIRACPTSLIESSQMVTILHLISSQLPNGIYSMLEMTKI